MDAIEAIIKNWLIFEIAGSLIKVTLGAGLCFGALKWRKGLLTVTAIGWGFILGGALALLTADLFGWVGIIIFILTGLVVLPILTYRIPAVNRFMLGFLVSSKLFFMLTTVLAKQGIMEISTAAVLPLVVGTMIGFILMAWTRVRVSAFILGCTFIGASEIAPVISEWINRIGFSLTGNPQFFFDPVDLIFAMFKIELTDKWTLGCMILFMAIGACIQIRNMKQKGIAMDTPLIVYESSSGPNGRIYNKDGKYIDTL